MIVYLAGLLDVPRTQVEAATIDGAGALRRYWHVTLPSISPVIFFTLVTGLIWTFQTFTEAYVAGNTTSVQKETSASPRGPAVLRRLPLPAGLPLLRHGPRVRHGVGAVRGTRSARSR